LADDVLVLTRPPESEPAAAQPERDAA
jgi:hypothetical protein